MEGPDCSRRGSDEGEEEAGGKPIDDAGVCGVEVCGGVCHGGEREPLRCRRQPLNVLAGSWVLEMRATYVPAHDNIQ